MYSVIYGGRAQAIKASLPKIRAEVEREFLPRLEAASTTEKRSIQKEIQEEVQRRLEAKFPPHALF